MGSTESSKSRLKKFNFSGPIYFCENFVNTDVMAPGRFDPIYDEEELAKIALIDYEGVEPFVDSAKNRSRFRIIVAGDDFGCGSSRETAPMAIAAAGVNVIAARSFGRIFFRNCINMGEILPLTIDHSLDKKIHGLEAKMSIEDNKITLGSASFEINPSTIVQEILSYGGLGKLIIANNGMRLL